MTNMNKLLYPKYTDVEEGRCKRYLEYLACLDIEASPVHSSAHLSDAVYLGRTIRGHTESRVKTIGQGSPIEFWLKSKKIDARECLRGLGVVGAGAKILTLKVNFAPSTMQFSPIALQHLLSPLGGKGELFKAYSCIAVALIAKHGSFYYARLLEKLIKGDLLW